MRTIALGISRRTFDAWNGEGTAAREWPADAAYRHCQRSFGEPAYTFTAWHEVMQERRDKQRRELDRKRQAAPSRIVPAYLWTFFNNTDFFGGWYCYICTRDWLTNSWNSDNSKFGVGFEDYHSGPAIHLMTEFNFGLFPVADNWERWLAEFTRRYPRKKPKRDRRKAGSYVGWYDRETRSFHREKP